MQTNTPRPSKSIAKLLTAKYGGKWTYRCGTGTWYCDDTLRYVSRVAMCDCDDDCNHTPGLCLYGPDRSEWIYSLERTDAD